MYWQQRIPKNLNEQHCSQTTSKSLGFQLQNPHSSSTESTSLSRQELTGMGKTSSQDQCASSDSVHDEGYGKHAQAKPALYLYNPEFSMSAPQVEISQPVVQFPYAYNNDPYLTGFFTGYGPHTMIQPQLMGAVPGRVPLPVDLHEDGPIYVNAKQYNGILRRRQARAKLEAQNKLVKTRKPYLHESRHQHALNRVRGSGGRFLSAKKTQQSDSHPPTSSESTQGSYHFNQMGSMLNSTEHLVANKQGAPPTAESTQVSGSEAVFQQQPDGRFSGIPSHMAVPMQGSGGLVYNGNRHYASIVR